MDTRFGLGPVFHLECLTIARRWQVYAVRALLVSSLLISLTLIWLAQLQGQTEVSLALLANVGRAFYGAIMGVELVLAIVLIPAVTAGAICQDKMRGGLTLMLVTDLSDAEIVLGRLTSRLLMVVGVIACSLPVLAIATMLGGVDPQELLFGSFVIVGVACLGVSLSLMYSVWATKPYEALMATYAAYAIWLLSLVVWGEVNWATVPMWLRVSNPFWLLFGARRLGRLTIWDFAHMVYFLLGCLAISAVLAWISIRKLRSVTLNQAGRVARRSRWQSFEEKLFPKRSDNTMLLDRDPVLWREWHRRRPSAWTRSLWRLYITISVALVLLASLPGVDIAMGLCGFMVALGLLIVCVNSATVLAEERVLGSLDILMTTTLSTYEIVSGKWWGAYRAVPKLAILPTLLAVITGVNYGRPMAGALIGLMIGILVLAYGAFVTSVCLALATWQPRLGRAVGLGVTVYIVYTVVFPTVYLVLSANGPVRGPLLWSSPFFGAYLAIMCINWPPPQLSLGDTLRIMVVWSTLLPLVAYGIFLITLRSFDRCLGRVSEFGHRRRSLLWLTRAKPRKRDFVT